MKDLLDPSKYHLLRDRQDRCNGISNIHKRRIHSLQSRKMLGKKLQSIGSSVKSLPSPFAQDCDARHRLTLESVLHGFLRIKGVITKSVKPAKKKTTEYAKNIVGHCQAKTIFQRGFHVPIPSTSPRTSLPAPFTSVSISGRYLRTSAFEKTAFPSPRRAVRRSSTVSCCAESIMPRMERTRLQYQKAGASQ